MLSLVWFLVLVLGCIVSEYVGNKMDDTCGDAYLKWKKLHNINFAITMFMTAIIFADATVDCFNIDVQSIFETILSSIFIFVGTFKIVWALLILVPNYILVKSL